MAKKIKSERKYFIYIFLFIVFLALYFFIVTSFFQGITNAKFYDDIPDLFVALIAFCILVYSLDIKNRLSRKLICFGAIMIILDRLIQVILQEYQLMNEVYLGQIIWVILGSTGFLGIILILFGFGGLLK